MKRDRRPELLDKLADHLLEVGLGDTGLRGIAAAIGTSDRMLLYYFADKASLLAAVMAHVAQRFAVRLEALAGSAPLPARDLARDLPALATDAALWPYMRLWLEIAARAAAGDAACRSVGEAIGREFLAWIAARIAGNPAKRDAEAALLLQLTEGAILLHAIGMGDVRAQG